MGDPTPLGQAYATVRIESSTPFGNYDPASGRGPKRTAIEVAQ